MEWSVYNRILLVNSYNGQYVESLGSKYVHYTDNVLKAKEYPTKGECHMTPSKLKQGYTGHTVKQITVNILIKD